MDRKSEQQIDEQKHQRRATHDNLHGGGIFGPLLYQNYDPRISTPDPSRELVAISLTAS